jgi:hypothetical protein
MTRYCDIHGAIEVPEGPPNQIFKCDRDHHGKPCSTLLQLQPRVALSPEVQVNPPQNPTPHARADRADKLLHQAAFLGAYGKLGNITKAAAEADIGRSQHYEWMQDPEYERRFLDAHRLAIQTMVDRAQELAFGSAPDARLIVKLLESIPRAMMPTGWDFNPARRNELSGPGGGPIETNEVSARDALRSRIDSLAPSPDAPSGT